MSIESMIANSRAMMSSRNHPRSTGTDVQKRYLDDASIAFLKQRGELAGNVVNVGLEIVDYDRAYIFTGKFKSVLCRLSDPISPVATSIQKPDAFKLIKFLVSVGFINMGTKVRFTIDRKNRIVDYWLVISPENIPSEISAGQIRKCNRRYNRFDYYGNLISEPFLMDDVSSTAVDVNTSSAQTSIQTQRDAYACIMQLNEYTAHVNDNTRMVLGGESYTVRGMNNHSREFTDKRDSVRLLYFTLYKTQVDKENDDIINDIVDANLCVWKLVQKKEAMTLIPGSIGRVEVTALRNGIVPNEPYSIIWETSDPDVVSVDANGNYVTDLPGVATLTARLVENPDIVSTTEIEVSTVVVDNYTIVFSPQPPNSLNQMDSTLLTAFMYNNGVRQDSMPVTFSFDGVLGKHFTVSDVQANSVMLRCNIPASDWLGVTVSADTPVGMISDVVKIALLSV